LAWGRNFDESRIRMKNALDEFMIEGINTTIPLYKTIMNDPNFINGELSTDYLERFKILNKMNEDAKGAAKKSAKAAVAAVLLQSEFVRKSAAIQQSSVAKSKWKMMSG
jgi:acetyl-CoA/propionyl-CoA carboxylase